MNECNSYGIFYTIDEKISSGLWLAGFLSSVLKYEDVLFFFFLLPFFPLDGTNLKTF